VHGNDGTDEVSISGSSTVHEVRNGQLTQNSVSPEDAGLPAAPLGAIRGGNAEENARVFRSVLGGATSPIRDVVVLNAAAALVAADAAKDLKEGALVAAEAIDSGAAAAKLEDWLATTRKFDR
jgi:anthranilate phosphoribosyltransferase